MNTEELRRQYPMGFEADLDGKKVFVFHQDTEHSLYCIDDDGDTIVDRSCYFTNIQEPQEPKPMFSEEDMRKCWNKAWYNAFKNYDGQEAMTFGEYFSELIKPTPRDMTQDELIKWWATFEKPSEIDLGRFEAGEVHKETRIDWPVSHYRLSPSEPWLEIPKKEGE